MEAKPRRYGRGCALGRSKAMKAQTDTLLSYLSEVPDKLVLSNPRKKSEIYRKIVIRKLDKGYLAEQYTEKQVFHENFAFCELQRFMENILS